MPYVTGGLAIGRAQVTDRVSIQNYEFDQATYRSNQALTDTSLRVPVDNVGYAPGKFNQATRTSTLTIRERANSTLRG